jgi:drug/metabolite transporter (DMT)-like permease
VLGWALYTHGSSRFPEFSPLRYATLTAVTGTTTILTATAVADSFGWQHLPTAANVGRVWPQVAYLTLVAAVLAVLAWNIGIRRLGAANTALFMNLVPVVALLVAILRGYRPTAVELLGMAVTIGAIATANLIARRRVVTSAADHQAGSRSRQPVAVG